NTHYRSNVGIDADARTGGERGNFRPETTANFELDNLSTFPPTPLTIFARIGLRLLNCKNLEDFNVGKAKINSRRRWIFEPAFSYGVTLDVLDSVRGTHVRILGGAGCSSGYLGETLSVLLLAWKVFQL